MLRLTLSYDQLLTFIQLLMKTEVCQFESESVKRLSIAILRPFATRMFQKQFPVRAKLSVQLSEAECLALEKLFRMVPATTPDQLAFIADFQPQIHKVCL